MTSVSLIFWQVRRCWWKNEVGTNHSIITFNLLFRFSTMYYQLSYPTTHLSILTGPGTDACLRVPAWACYYINRCTATQLDSMCSCSKMNVPRCCFCINGANIWGRTHFPSATDDIWKPSRLSWIKAGIKGFSLSPPWTGRELCSRWGKTMPFASELWPFNKGPLASSAAYDRELSLHI